MRCFVQVVLQNTQRVGERESSRGDRFRGGRVGHHLTQDAMSEEQAVEFLHDAAWGFATQLDGSAVEMRFDFVKDEFLFPALMVNQWRFQRGQVVGIEQVGEQAMTLAAAFAAGIVVCVLDDAHDSTIAFSTAIGEGRIDATEIGAIGQVFEPFENQLAGFDSRASR